MANELNITADAPHALIPPGGYDAVCFKAEYGPTYGGKKKLFLSFRIHGGQKHNIQLFMAMSKPDKKLSPPSKMYDAWCIALGRKPHKGERFSKEIFVGKMFRVLVRTTIRKFSNGETKPESLQYSVVQELLCIVAGAPIGNSK